RRIHEHHLEQEQHHDGDVIRSVMHQKIAILAEEAERFVEEFDAVLHAEWRNPAEVAIPTQATHLDGEADQPVSKHADAVHHKVHHHRVVRVLGAAQTCLHDREAGLHEHDQEASDQRPNEIDGDFILADLIDYVADREALGFRGLIGNRVSDGYIR